MNCKLYLKIRIQNKYINIYIKNHLTAQCFDTVGMLQNQGVTGKSFSKQIDYTEK